MTERSTLSPFFNDVAANDGMSLLSIVTYSHIPHILMFMNKERRPLINREVAKGVGMDESLCAKLLKYAAKNGLVCPTEVRGHRGAIYTLAEMGERCADLLEFIVIYGDVCLASKTDSIQSIDKNEEVKA